MVRVHINNTKYIIIAFIKTAYHVLQNSIWNIILYILYVHWIDYVIPYAVVRGMVTPPDEIEFTNTISGVLCISDTLL